MNIENHEQIVKSSTRWKCWKENSMRMSHSTHTILFQIYVYAFRHFSSWIMRRVRRKNVDGKFISLTCLEKNGHKWWKQIIFYVECRNIVKLVGRFRCKNITKKAWKKFVTFSQCDDDGDGKRGFHYFEEVKWKKWKKENVENLIIIQDTQE